MYNRRSYSTSARRTMLFAGIVGIISVLILIVLALSGTGPQAENQQRQNEFWVGDLVSVVTKDGTEIIIFPSEGTMCDDAISTWGPRDKLARVTEDGSAVFKTDGLTNVSLEITCGEMTIRKTLLINR